MKYEYRKRVNYRTNNKHSEWQKCSEKDKLKIEQNAPDKFEFRLVEKPEPTPSMKPKNETDTKKD